MPLKRSSSFSLLIPAPPICSRRGMLLPYRLDGGLRGGSWGYFCRICQFKQNICMARLIERTPAGEIFALEPRKPFQHNVSCFLGNFAIPIIMPQRAKPYFKCANTPFNNLPVSPAISYLSTIICFERISKVTTAPHINRVFWHSPALGPLALNANWLFHHFISRACIMASFILETPYRPTVHHWHGLSCQCLSFCKALFIIRHVLNKR